MSDILATIDAAVEDLCACGCGSPLAADGASGWFASETCQQQWHGGVPTPFGPVDPDAFQRALGQFAELVRDFLGQIGTALTQVFEELELAGTLPAQPPADVMGRALWLRQHRNTGPAARARAPRRIDPRRAR